MKDDIKEKIRIYCEKINLKMDQLSITITEEGYVATDGYTSIMFDKEGNVSSLPMYQAYGKEITKLEGIGSAIYVYVIIAIAIVVIIAGVIK